MHVLLQNPQKLNLQVEAHEVQLLHLYSRDLLQCYFLFNFVVISFINHPKGSFAQHAVFFVSLEGEPLVHYKDGISLIPVE